MKRHIHPIRPAFHNDDPGHRARYYGRIAASVLVLGLLYLAFSHSPPF